MDIRELEARLKKLEELWQCIEVAKFMGSIEAWELAQEVAVQQVDDGD